MANATARVAKGSVRWNDNREFPKVPLKTITAETTYYTGAMVGLNVNGYHEKFDDTVEMVFAGLVRGREGNPVMAVATQGDAGHELDLHRPPFFELAISGVAITDLGKKVYASDDQTGVLTNGGTYGNFVGTVESLLYVTGNSPVSGIALVRACYDGIAGHAKFNTARTLAATGAVTLTKLDLGKTIVLTNTAAQTVTLPAVAGTQAGDWLKFIKKSTDAFAVTLDGASSEEIDSSTTLATIDAEHDCATLVSDGTQWHVISRDIT